GGRSMSAAHLSVTATTRPCTACGDSVRLRLEPVRKRLEDRHLAGALAERLRKQPVREPRVSGQQRAVAVRSERAAEPTARGARPAVVPEPRHDAAERLGALVEYRPAGMVLEAGKRPAVARLELAFEQHVADHP